MNERLQRFADLVDVDHNGKVDVADAQRAFEIVDDEVTPHGWLWTLSVACIFVLIGFALGRCS